MTNILWGKLLRRLQIKQKVKKKKKKALWDAGVDKSFLLFQIFSAFRHSTNFNTSKVAGSY